MNYTYSTVNQFIPAQAVRQPVPYGFDVCAPLNIEIDFKPTKNITMDSYNPSYIAFENKFYYFKNPINCNVFSKGNIFYCEFKDLKIKSFGASLNDAINAFNFTFHSLFINYASETNQNLSKDARRLKDKILDLVLIAL